MTLLSTTGPPATGHAFVVVGTVRNCAAHLEPDIRRIRAALAPFGTVRFLLVESDSTDDTVSRLCDLAASDVGVAFLNFGPLADRYSRRTQRIAACRNAYVEALENDDAYAEADIVVVADFDGLNTRLTAKSVGTCFDRSDWDVCTANQAGPYYDVFALRHPDWCPNDAWAEEAFLRAHGVSALRSVRSAVHVRMITIPETSPWIEVDLAFGGFALYRRAAFREGRYDGLTSEGREVCEHVAFHARLRAKGRRIFINPGLVNAGRTEHTHIARLAGALLSRAFPRVRASVPMRTGARTGYHDRVPRQPPAS